MKPILTAFFIGLFGSVMTCSSAWAQATAQISGAVQDQSGAVLPGAEVTATQPDQQYTPSGRPGFRTGRSAGQCGPGRDTQRQCWPGHGNRANRGTATER